MSRYELPALTTETFDTATAQGLTLVDFWSPTCAPCKVTARQLDELSRDEAFRNVNVRAVNVQEEPALQGRFRIQGLPTVMAMRDGQIIGMISGSAPSATYRRLARDLQG